MRRFKWFFFGMAAAIVVIVLQTGLNNQSWPILKRLVGDAPEKTVVVGISNASITLDPAIALDQESFRITTNIFDTLVQMDDNLIVPGLAEDWRVTEDGLVWTFEIRKGIGFHDGNTLSAEDIVWNFDRWMNEKNAYHFGRFTYWNMNFGGFPGIVKSVNALPENTVQIVLTEPYAPFLSTLAMPAFGIASPAAIERDREDFANHPVGTGPFVLREIRDNGEVVLEKNDEYWGKRAQIDQLVYRAIPDSEERINQMIQGDLQMVDEVTEEEARRLESESDAVVYNRPIFNIGYLAMNMNHSALRDQRVRKAIAHVIDRDALLEGAFDNFSRKADAFLPPVLWGHNESIEPPAHDVEAGLALLKEAGYEQGLTLHLLVMESPRAYLPNPVKVAETLQYQLETAGIYLLLDVQPLDEYLKYGQNGNYDLILAGWNGDIVDPDNFLYSFFASENSRTGVVSNYAFYKSQEVDDLLQLARQSTDQAFRNDLYRKVQVLIARDIPAIPIAHTISSVAVSQNIKEYKPSITGIDRLNTIELKEEPES